MYYGAAYYPEHRDPERWEHDLQNMSDAGVNCLRVAEFAWILLEPSDGIYDFSWLDKFKNMASAHGIQLLLCPPLRTLPAWLVEQDRGLLIEDERGHILEFGSRYSFCINHPLLLQKGKALAIAMAEHYGNDSDIAGWHLDNEHGDEPDCHCPICHKKFQQWCEGKYKTIDVLNEAWGLRFWGLNFQSFSQIPTPRLTKTFHSPGHSLDWRRFRSACTVEAVAMQSEAVKNITLNQFVTTNFQAMWNPRTDYYEMAKPLDIVGTNYYPQYGEKSRDTSFALAALRCYKPLVKDFQVHELRNGPHAIAGAAGNTPDPGEVARLAMHCVANGATALFFFRWRACPFGCEQHHGTITGYDGERLDIYPEVAKLGGWLKEYSSILDKVTVKSDVAILYEFSTRWVMETGVSWNGPKYLYTDQCKIIYNSVKELGYECDAVNSAGDFSPFKVLIVPALACMNDELAEKFKLFVEGGGTLIWHPFSGTKDSNAIVYGGRLNPVMQELFSLDVNNYATIPSDDPCEFSWNGKAYKATMFCDLAKVMKSDVVCEGEYNEGVFYAGSPVVFQRNVGKGQVIYINNFAEKTFYSDFFMNLFRKINLCGANFSSIPERVEVCTQTGDGIKLVFLVNHSMESQTVGYNGEWFDIYNSVKGSGDIDIAPHGSVVLKLAEASCDKC